MTPRISVLLPSRGRPGPLAESVAGLFAYADEPSSIEVLVAADPDDEGTQDVAFLLSRMGRVQCWTAPTRFGYAQLHLYVNELARRAQGEWLMLWNDDARMLTYSWEVPVISAPEQCVMWPQHNGNMSCNVFPIWPRAWTERLGHVSLNAQCDTWIQEIGTLLSRQYIIPVQVIHERADLTGKHDDQTFRESQAGYQSRDFYSGEKTAARQRDAAAVREIL